MKFTVDVECTPQELRTFLGLPDVEPMQKAVMDEMQRRMVASMDQFSPASVMKDWFAPMTAVQQAFTSAMTGAAGAAGTTAGASARAAGARQAARSRPSDSGESEEGDADV